MSDHHNPMIITAQSLHLLCMQGKRHSSRHSTLTTPLGALWMEEDTGEQECTRAHEKAARKIQVCVGLSGCIVTSLHSWWASQRAQPSLSFMMSMLAAE